MTCHCMRRRKKRPYGAKRGKYWCDYCDANLVPSEPSKKAERHKAKREIKKAMEEQKDEE